MEKIIEGIVKFLLDNPTYSLAGLSVVLVPLAGFLFKYLYARHQNAKAARDLVEFQYKHKNVKNKRKFFIETQGQNIRPSVEEEQKTGSAFIVKRKLIPFFMRTAFTKKEKDKYYLILADSGMGKTTFMINLYLQYSSFFNFRKKYKIKLLPFGDSRIIENLKEMAKKRDEVKDTILLLDAFDEYKGLLPPEKPDGLTNDERFRKQLDEIVELTRDFREVVITSRTQYFPGQEDRDYMLKIPTFDESGFHTLVKMYLSPFDDKEIQRYLNKKFGWLKFWNFKKKRIAKSIIDSSPKLMVRPMLLSYIDYLIDGNQKFANTYQVYETLIEKWIEREAKKRKNESTSREKFKQDLHSFSNFIAIEIYHQFKNNGNLAIDKVTATEISRQNNLNLKDYEITGQSLLTRDLTHNWKFAHKSILEFLLAKQCINNIDFASEFEFTGMDMAETFCSEIGLISFILSNYAPIKGGEFLMGSPENEVSRISERETQHRVKLSDFFMCKYAITIADFKRFRDDNPSYLTDAEKGGGSYVWSGKEWKMQEGVNWCYGVSGKERPPSEYNHPVVHVSWNDAVAYCGWLSSKTGKHFRLPTEAEWEYACRADTTTPFHTGNNLTTDQANYDGNYPYNKNKKGIYRQNTVPVHSFDPNAFGLFNMHGNVWEWCSDWYDEKYYDECKVKGVLEDPDGPHEGSYRVVRGGSWNSDAERCRTAPRYGFSPVFRRGYIGFRLVFVP